MPIPVGFEAFCKYLDGRVEDSTCVFDAGRDNAWNHDATWAIGAYLEKTNDRKHRFVIVGRNGKEKIVVEPIEGGYIIRFEGVYPIKVRESKTITRKMDGITLRASIARGSNAITCEALVKGKLNARLLEDIVGEFVDMIRELSEAVEVY